MKRLPKYIQQTQGKLWLTEDDRDNLKISYKIKEVLFEATSDFQHVMILDSDDFGPMLVLDGAVQTTAEDGHIYNEMIAHVPLILHPNPKRVLIIGGGDCGAAREVAKYKQVEQIDMVEIDELVVKASKQYLPQVSGNLSDPRVNFIFADGVAFVKSVKEKYDVIIVDSSDPVGPAVQLFESAFYENLHRALHDGGIMVCQSQSPIFQPDIMKQSYDRIGNIFTHHQLYTAVVPTYPGGLWSFTIGSKQPLRSVEQVVFDKETKYINQAILNSCFQLPQFVQDYLQGELVSSR
ncbi:polyamine aminopropyltransferase [Paenibacillus yanchengensis]|uniref:Polyamine aminopropyltransferase n=1 Tax=Paenibacillus yanchengensis TaxID=2035833 RepID=A0ABW4YIM8_9BACL